MCIRDRIKAVGEKFDPNFHEAIMRIADETKEDDTICLLYTSRCV